jgi:hypothetical protein
MSLKVKGLDDFSVARVVGKKGVKNEAKIP